MTGDIALLLAQDGLTNGAIYALLALAFVLIFAVTRIIFIPQGEFVSYGALTLASIQAGKVPPTIWLLLLIGGFIAVTDGLPALRDRRLGAAAKAFGLGFGVPAAIAAVSWLSAGRQLPLFLQIVLALAIVVPLGPMIYHTVFRSVVNASVLVLLIIAVAVHFVLLGVGLLLFGPDGYRTIPISNATFEIGGIAVSAQSLWIIGASAVLMAALYTFFNYSIEGKALRATAINQTGARLVGVSPTYAGAVCFTVAAAIGVVSGIFISPITAMYYDSGLVIGLKGLVAATIGGLISYPIAALGAAIVALFESFSSFYASAFKELIVFTLIIPVLVIRATTTPTAGGGEE